MCLLLIGGVQLCLGTDHFYTGLYTAPSKDGTFTVVATLRADASKSSSASVRVLPVSVEVEPSLAILEPGGKRAFRAHLRGSHVLVDVTWIMQEASTGGSIAENGTYTAPTTLGTYHLNPTSVFDPTQSDTANISVVASRFFSTTGRMARPRSSHTATELLSGKVLVAGGFTEFGEFSAISASELYDPDSASFSTTGSMTTERALN